MIFCWLVQCVDTGDLATTSDCLPGSASERTSPGPVANGFHRGLCDVAAFADVPFLVLLDADGADERTIRSRVADSLKTAPTAPAGLGTERRVISSSTHLTGLVDQMFFLWTVGRSCSVSATFGAASPQNPDDLGQLRSAVDSDGLQENDAVYRGAHLQTLLRRLGEVVENEVESASLPSRLVTAAPIAATRAECRPK